MTTDPRTPKPMPNPEAVALPFFDQLEQLLRRREEGEISAEEYERLKAELLGKM